jgi:hypothetical protein
MKYSSPQIEIRHVIFPGETSNQIMQFIRDWTRMADSVRFNYLMPLTPLPIEVHTPNKRCRDIRRELYMGWEGNVPLCGYETLAGTPEVLGNLHNTTIKDLWQHPRIKKVRQCHTDKNWDEVEFCKACVQTQA